jgi:hypothetical protein
MLLEWGENDLPLKVKLKMSEWPANSVIVKVARQSRTEPRQITRFSIYFTRAKGEYNLDRLTFFVKEFKRSPLVFSAFYFNFNNINEALVYARYIIPKIETINKKMLI